MSFLEEIALLDCKPGACVYTYEQALAENPNFKLPDIPCPICHTDVAIKPVKVFRYPIMCRSCFATERERRIAEMHQNFHQHGRISFSRSETPVSRWFRGFPLTSFPKVVQSDIKEFVDKRFVNHLMLGGTGTHKTTAAHIACLEWLAKHSDFNEIGDWVEPSIEFVRWQDLLKYSSASESYYNENTEYDGIESINPNYAKRLIAAFKTCDLLVMDDVGTQAANTEARVGKIYDIVDTRWQECRSTLFTSNATGARLDERFKSRAGHGRTTTFDGKDSRRE